MDFTNKVVLITGASKGLGRELAFAFGNAGANLVICSRTEKTLLKVKSELEAKNINVLAVVANVSNPEDVERLVSLAESRFQVIDILINNASILGPSPMPELVDYPLDDFKDVLLTNIMNPFLVTKRVLSNMLVRNTGSIINVTSEVGHIGYAGWGAYGISKFGLEGLTYTWADELAGTNVRINMIDPGEMDTDMHALAVPDCNYTLNDPKDISRAFLYVASNDSKHLNGKLLEAEEILNGREAYVNKLSEL